MTASATAEKPLPQNVEADRAMLGCVLIDPDALAVVRRIAVEPDSPYTDADRIIYRAMCALGDAGTPVDLITLCDELARRGQLEHIGGTGYVASLANQVPNSMMAEEYARIVARYACARHFLEASAAIAAAAYDVPADVDGAVTYFRSLIDGARGEGLGAAAPFHLLSVADILSQPRPAPLIAGLYSLDSLGITFAPAGVGKTALLLDQMAHVALDRPWNGHAVHGGYVIYICAEGQAFLPERLEALLLKLGVDDIPRLRILPVAVQLLEPRTVPGLIATFTAELEELPKWIAFDTISQTAGGADENDASEMAGYIQAMARIRESTGAFVQAVHHTGKEASRGARGSSVFDGNIDTVVQIAEGETKGVAVVTCKKQRGGALKFDPFAFRVVPRYLDEQATRPGPVIELCDVPGDKTEVPAKPPKQTQAVYDVFLQLYAEYEPRGEGVYYGTWLKACEAAGIAESTFKHARNDLVKKFGLVHQPDSTGEYYPTQTGNQPGPMGQDKDNWLGADLGLSVSGVRANRANNTIGVGPIGPIGTRAFGSDDVAHVNAGNNRARAAAVRGMTLDSWVTIPVGTVVTVESVAGIKQSDDDDEPEYDDAS